MLVGWLVGDIGWLVGNERPCLSVSAVDTPVFGGHFCHPAQRLESELDEDNQVGFMDRVHELWNQFDDDNSGRSQEKKGEGGVARGFGVKGGGWCVEAAVLQRWIMLSVCDGWNRRVG